MGNLKQFLQSDLAISASDDYLIEQKIGHCAINQLTHLLYKREAKASLSYKLKLHDDCERAVIEYLKACVQIASHLFGQADNQRLEN